MNVRSIERERERDMNRVVMLTRSYSRSV